MTELASQEVKATATTILLSSQSAVLRGLNQTGETMMTKGKITHTRRAMSAEAKMSVKYANICMLVRTKIRPLRQRASYEGEGDQSLSDRWVSSLHTNGVRD